MLAIPSARSRHSNYSTDVKQEGSTSFLTIPVIPAEVQEIHPILVFTKIGENR